MILESLFRIASARVKKDNALPEYITIQRDGFRRKYHINEVVSIASKIVGKSRSVGVKNVEAAKEILLRARDVMFVYRQCSPVACWALIDLPKTEIKSYVRIVDLREKTCNVAGLALTRLNKALTRDADMQVSHQDSMAAIQLMMETDLVIVETPLECQRMQDYLASRVLKPVVVHTKEIEGYYDAPITEGTWSKPTVAHG